MLITACLVVVVAGRLLADFYFQPQSVARKKRNSFGWMVLHCIEYAAVMAIICLFVFIPLGKPAIWAGSAAWLVISISHAIIDFLKENAVQCIDELRVFLADQFLHIVICTGACACGLVYLSGSVGVQTFLYDSQIFVQILVVFASLVFAITPCSVFIRLLLAKIDGLAESEQGDSQESQTQKNRPMEWCG